MARDSRRGRRSLDCGRRPRPDAGHGRDGLPYYIAPEQLRAAKDVDGRADIWALGAILYELVSGCVPFPAESITQLCMMVMETEPPALDRVRADVPPELAAVIQRCLAKKAGDRFASIAELAAALRPHAELIAPGQ